MTSESSSGSPGEARDRLRSERSRVGGLLEDVFSTSSAAPAESERESISELSGVDQHAADTATETQAREQNVSLIESLEAEVRDIDEALARLEAGTYGRCVVCGSEISPPRLDALPATPYCITHARMAEREAAHISDIRPG